MRGTGSEFLTGGRGGGLLVEKCWLGTDLGAFRSTTLEMVGWDRVLSPLLLPWKVVVFVISPPRANLNLDGLAPRAAVDVPKDGDSMASEFLRGVMVDIADGLKSGPAF